MIDVAAIEATARVVILWLVERGGVATIVLAVAVLLALALRRRGSAHGIALSFTLPLVVLAAPVESALPGAWPSPWPSETAAVVRRAFPAPGPDETRVASSGPTVYVDATSGDDAGTTDVVARVPTPSERVEAPLGPEAAAVPTPPPSTPSLLFGWLALTWLGIALALGVHQIARELRSRSFLRRTARPAPDHVATLVARRARALGVRRPVTVSLCRHLDSPATSGVRRPVLHLPPDLVDRLSIPQLRFVVDHELAHVRRHDVLLEAGCRAICTAFWFVPTAWISAALVRRWRELACDEAALAATASPTRTPIAEALFALAAPDQPLPGDGAMPPTPTVARLLSQGSLMRRRMTRILDPELRPERRTGLAHVATATTVLLAALTAARAQEGAAGTSTDPSRPLVAAPEDATPETDPVAAAIDRGVDWLLAHQAEDGHWSIEDRRPEHEREGPAQHEHNEVHVTGLAIRALLPELDGPRRRDVTPAIQRAARYLEASQQENGRFGPDDYNTMMYGHGQALRALAAVQHRWPEPERLAILQRGVDYAEDARNPYRGWRFQPKCGDNDSKITGMMTLGLLEAAAVGCEVPSEGLQCAINVLDELTDEDTGRTGFVARGAAMSRMTTKADDFPGKYSEEPTAIHLLVQLRRGRRIVDHEGMQKAIDLLLEQRPLWSKTRGSTDLAYWCFASQAMGEVGGWQEGAWRAALHESLLPHQLADGHWPADDAWSHAGMEAYSTASALIALRATRATP